MTPEQRLALRHWRARLVRLQRFYVDEAERLAQETALAAAMSRAISVEIGALDLSCAMGGEDLGALICDASAARTANPQDLGGPHG